MEWQNGPTPTPGEIIDIGKKKLDDFWKYIPLLIAFFIILVGL
ncbi:MAG: hypothetical protein Q8R14_03140 [Candidatus Omnitrophota bacterium]|nr:hypothetical protein [Candidatus Omnitrophota bacterium]